MPPFKAGKATRNKLNPDGRQMRRLERQFEQAVGAALGRWWRDISKGVTADDPQEMERRLADPEILGRVEQVLVAELQTVAVAGADFGREQVERHVLGTIKQGAIGINWELANNNAAEWALDNSGALLKDLTQARVRRVQKEVARFIESPESMPELRKRLEGMFDKRRAHLIAATEVTNAFAAGNVEAWKESGVIERHRWNTANDEIVCPICGPLHNMIVSIEGEFEANRSDNGAAMVVQRPPAHPACRCWLTPVVEGAEERPVGLGEQPIDESVIALERPVEVDAPLVVTDYEKGREWVEDPEHFYLAFEGTERFALEAYTAEDYKVINAALRDGKVADLSALHQNVLSNTSSALTRLPAYDGNVYRGMQFKPAELDKFIANAKRAQEGGEPIHMPSFTSTATDRKIAEGFTPGGDKGGVIMEMKSKSGRVVDGISEYPEEDEVLFNRGAKFKVTGFSTDDRGRPVVHMEEVG